MNLTNTLQAKFQTIIQANEWVNKKMASGKWVNGKIKNAIVQEKEGKNINLYFASVQNATPVFCPYTNKPINKILFSKEKK